MFGIRAPTVFDHFYTSNTISSKIIHQFHPKHNPCPALSPWNWPKLVLFFGFRCKSLTMDCFSVPKSNSPLKHISVNDSAQFNDKVFKAAFKSFPKLQLLKVSGFRLFSRTSIEKVIKEQPSRVIIHQEKVYISQQMKAEDLLEMSKNRLFQVLNSFQPNTQAFIQIN